MEDCQKIVVCFLAFVVLMFGDVGILLCFLCIGCLDLGRIGFLGFSDFGT